MQLNEHNAEEEEQGFGSILALGYIPPGEKVLTPYGTEEQKGGTKGGIKMETIG